jgi:hypothetical protein
MKNIHVLPTGKPSRLKQNKITKKYSLSYGFIDLTSYTPVNIYITSDEEIKEGDRVINLNSPYAHKELCRIDNQLELERYAKKTSNNCKKIILTTDVDLIADGVQAIDDEFLEWFVKNPGCESVEVLYEPKNFLDTKQGWEYLIVSKILKEEPTLEEEYLKDELKKYEGIGVVVLNKPEEPKQETPKEIAERYYEDEVSIAAFINGYKLAQEQDKLEIQDLKNRLDIVRESSAKAINMIKDLEVVQRYSEEEVLETLNEFSIAGYSPIEKFEIPEWFKKYKTNKI